MSKNFVQKVEGGGGLFSCHLFTLVFLSRFWPFLCMRSSKTPQKYFRHEPGRQLASPHSTADLGGAELGTKPPKQKGLTPIGRRGAAGGEFLRAPSGPYVEKGEV
jgi:hypothetical protein